MDIATDSRLDADGHSIVTVVGAVDLTSRDTLLEAGRAALNADGAAALVLDLAGVTFIDSTGIGVLVQLAGDAADLQRAFTIAQPSPRVTRILEVTGLQQQWDIRA